MMIQLRQMSLLLGAMVIFKFFVFPFNISATSPNSPDKEVRITSRYVSSTNGRTKQTLDWVISEFQNLDGNRSIKFFPASGDKIKPICEIVFYFDGAEELIRWNGLGKGKERLGRNGLMIVPGYPVPCDILPLQQNESVQTYTSFESVGGRQFKKIYKVSVETVKKEEAFANGWSKNDSTSANTQFKMLYVYDDMEQLVVKQLWPLNENWWVYEETPYRQSWKLP